jgi:hypothetical protein
MISSKMNGPLILYLAQSESPAQLYHPHAHLTLLQNGHDLFYRKALPLHGKIPLPGC